MQWYEDENFWLNFEEMMFDPDRLVATPFDVLNMVSLCGLKPTMTVLDHCCGFGRHALEFAKLGYKTTGVDRCSAYLDRAKGKSKKHKLPIEWVQEDVRTFSRAEQFDFAYNFFTSFGYVEDPEEELAVVQNVWKSLKTGGKFLIDVEGKETLAKSFCESQWFDGQDGSIMLVGAQIIDNWTRVENRWGYVKDGQYVEKIFAHKLYSAWELGDLLSRGGFSQVEFYGNLEGGPYDNEAERLIAVATK